jgi:nucleotide-binding universal stress UspA family protein
VHSHNALRYASRLAEQFGATLRLVYVVEPNVYPADLGFGQVVYPTYEEELVKKGTDELERTAREDVPAGVRAVSKVRTGKPHQEILADAREQKADLIVMATHGHTGVEHILFGSTAERVVRGAPCPVLTIRPDVPV